MAWLQQATGLSFLFPVQIKAVIITLQWICRRLTVCFIICHHVAWPVDRYDPTEQSRHMIITA